MAETAASRDNRPRTARPSDKSPPTRTADQFALAGPSQAPDPRTHAYRKDLADASLAGRVIASHYAEPVCLTLGSAAVLRNGPSAESDAICELDAGAPFELLDDSVGWAWGYAGTDRIVGYVQSKAIAAG